MIGVRPHLAFNFEPPAQAPTGTRMKGHDWTAVIIKIKKLAIVLFSAYFSCNGDFQVVNTAKLNQILECKKSLGLPAILMADYNYTPSEVTEMKWPKLFDGVILAPKEVDATCSSGKGRLIDFAIVSTEIVQLCELHPVTVPWGGHILGLNSGSRKT